MVKFANRMTNLKPAAVYELVGEIAKIEAQENRKIVPLYVGNPGKESIPTDKIAEITAEVLSDEEAVKTLLYGPTEGFQPLRNELTAYLAENFGIGTPSDRIIITSGATQAIELCARVFCNEGDTIITENPTFVGSLGSFNGFGINIVGVSMDTDGINLDKLEEALKANPETRFIYVIPNFHNPTSWTMTLEKRKRLYEMALKYKTMILEDDAYRDLRYFGEDLPTLKSMDSEGIVLYAGSFSKVISPGLRVGYLMANERFMDKISAAKQVTDVHTTTLSQKVVYGFMKKYGLEGHIDEIRDIYRKKMQLTFDLLEEHLGDKIEYVKPEGGLYVYCKLPEHIDVLEFYQKGIDMGVAVVYGSAFYVDPGEKSQYFRINFSQPSEAQLKKGIEILGQVMKLFN
ncbi:MAG: PLP-dependent aminotransferase family protein [Clostridiales bacterium]|jgi:2-aminoadipate transaminase|nr:PLP-dependent aminotransferase family protein [Clostridiales bacterium]